MNSYDKQSYGKDSNNYDKSKDSITVKKIKCNNININLNGFSGNEIGASSNISYWALATDEAQADEGEIGANSFESDDSRTSGSDSDSRFVCINNNNNKVVAEETPEPEPLTCEECFTEFLTEGQIAGFEELATVTIALCEFATTPGNDVDVELIMTSLEEVGVPDEVIPVIIECLRDAGFNFVT